MLLGLEGGGDEGDELTFIVLALGQLKVRHGSSSPGTPCSPKTGSSFTSSWGLGKNEDFKQARRFK